MRAKTSSSKAFQTLSPLSLAPVVLSCEHASNRLPFRTALSAPERRILRSHWGWDIGAWELTRELSRRLRTSAVGGLWSRLLVDLNRRVDDRGLTRRSAEGVELSFNRDLGPEDVEKRVLDYHMPYHQELDRLILRRLVRGERPLLFAVHTFTPVFDGRVREFDIGVLYEEHARLAHRLGRRLRAAGWRVRYNQPYSGMAGMMYSVDRHGKHHRLPCLELEVNHDLFRKSSTVPALGCEVAEGILELVADSERRR